MAASAAVKARSAEENRAEAAKPVSTLAWLVGDVWTADASQLGRGMQKIETRYVVGQQCVHPIHDAFCFGQGGSKNLRREFFLECATVEPGDVVHGLRECHHAGPMKMEGDTLQINFHGEDFEGKPADLRVDVVRKTNDKYQWVLQEKQGDAWSS